MSYSCVDFVDDVIGTLGVDAPDDDPEEQVEIVIKEILRRERVTADLLAALEVMVSHQGARNGPDYDAARAAIAKARGDA